MKGRGERASFFPSHERCTVHIYNRYTYYYARLKHILLLWLIVLRIHTRVPIYYYILINAWHYTYYTALMITHDWCVYVYIIYKLIGIPIYILIDCIFVLIYQFVLCTPYIHYILFYVYCSNNIYILLHIHNYCGALT